MEKKLFSILILVKVLKSTGYKAPREEIVDVYFRK